MYVFKKDGQEVAAQEWPVWVPGVYGWSENADG